MALTAIAGLACRDLLRQPATWLMAGIALALLALSYVFGMFNFEIEDRLRMLGTAGVAVAVIAGLFTAVLGAGASVHDELASRTALTLFAKPVSRAAFVLGKALGVWLACVGLHLLLAAAHVGLIWAATATGFEWEAARWGQDELHPPWAALASAHALAVFHTAIMACVATVGALRLPLAANIMLCFAVFIAGHLTATTGLVGGPLPALAAFNVDDWIQVAVQPVVPAYLAWAAAYAVLVCAGVLALGLALFERQDIP